MQNLPWCVPSAGRLRELGECGPRASLGSAERHQEICGEVKEGIECLRKRPREEMKNVSVGKPLSWSVQKEFLKPDFWRGRKEKWCPAGVNIHFTLTLKTSYYLKKNTISFSTEQPNVCASSIPFPLVSP